MLSNHPFALGELQPTNNDFSIIKWHPLLEPQYKGNPHTHDPTRKGFLDLPGELRNQIYRLEFVQRKAIDGRRTKLPSIVLLRTCKKVNEEASSILYSENIFTFGIAINFTNLQRMGLHCFPLGFHVWPSCTHQQWLRKLHIGISFTPGGVIDFAAPQFIIEDIKAMREAYEECWEDLDLTYEMCEGTCDRLTFTMAWLKFGCFGPISHPHCKVQVKDNISPLVRWCLEAALTGRDHYQNLYEEQVHALDEASRIAQDSYNSGMHRVCTDLSWRLVWGCPIENTRAGIVNWIGQAGPVVAPIPIRRRIYDQKEVYHRVSNAMGDSMAADILMDDNLMRVFAALDMPEEKDLLIEKCAELRIYFALQEMAAKVVALDSSLQS